FERSILEHLPDLIYYRNYTTLTRCRVEINEYKNSCRDFLDSLGVPIRHPFFYNGKYRSGVGNSGVWLN
ncbi:hypothetical protein M3661_09325, partial [Paenibacillus sp. MER 180]|uniref:hypothetical protein n=1 Tax=Paenibacillus sp. MER 180 TaxID=2939570 RepID=UPI00204009F4